MEGSEIQISRKGKGFAWGASVFVSLCCIFTCMVLFQSTGTFKELFKGLGVELPLPTQFLIATYSWLYPVLFVGAAVAVIAKEFLLRDIGRRLAVTTIIFLAVISSAELVRYALSLPLLDLVKKLSDAK